jgi:hypothetical protein
VKSDSEPPPTRQDLSSNWAEAAGLLLTLGVGLFIAGRLVDLAWHATHTEFETAADQVRAHAVVWLATIVILWAATVALVRRVRLDYTVVLTGAVGYAVVAVWHFIEHAGGRDPELPHILLLITNVVIFAGAAWVGFAAWRRRSVG